MRKSRSPVVLCAESVVISARPWGMMASALRSALSSGQGQWLASHANPYSLPTSPARTQKAIPVDVNSKSPRTHPLSVRRYQHCQRGPRALSCTSSAYGCTYSTAVSTPSVPLPWPHCVASAYCPRCGVGAFCLECQGIVTSCNLCRSGLPTSS